MSWATLLEAACAFYERHLTDDHRAYLHSRYGLQVDFVRAARVGYAPRDGAALLMHLMAQGFETKKIVQSGLVAQWEKDGRSGVSDLFRGRLVFPYLDEDRRPAFFIARATPETPAPQNGNPPKYKKQAVTPDGPQEPIFGAWSISPGVPVIVTEGITDAMAALQTGHPTISPVTTAFKRARIDDAVEHCRKATAAIILNDSEDSGAGDLGAAKTAVVLQMKGVPVRIGTIPRPEGVTKTDLNDYLRNGGSLDQLIDAAVPADDHPAYKEEVKRRWEEGAARLAGAIKRQRRALEPPRKRRKGESKQIDIDQLRARMPSISDLSGIPPGKQGVHPVYGSSGEGRNFKVSDDGETWTSFHGGPQAGKSGNVFKLVALMEGLLNDESAALTGDSFKQTIQLCQERWGK